MKVYEYKTTQGGEKMKIRSLFIVAIGDRPAGRRSRRACCRRRAVPHRRGDAQRQDGHGLQPVHVRRAQAVQKEMGGESALQIAYSENMYKVPDAAAAIRDYASQGFDIVHCARLAVRLLGAGDRQGLPQDDLCLGHRREHLRPAERATPTPRPLNRAATSTACWRPG